MATVFDPQTEPIVDSDMLYEVVDGEIVEKQPMGAYEELFGLTLYDQISAYAAPRSLGRAAHEVLFNLAPLNASRRPDVAFVSKDRWTPGAINLKTPSWNVVPNLAVEIVSPTNRMNEVVGKVHEYFSAGVVSVWVILPEYDQVHVYDSPHSNRILTRDDELTGEPVLPGFRLPLRDWFGELENADAGDATAE
jgi:Uma2 family endonuclease